MLWHILASSPTCRKWKSGPETDLAEMTLVRGVAAENPRSIA